MQIYDGREFDAERVRADLRAHFSVAGYTAGDYMDLFLRCKEWAYAKRRVRPSGVEAEYTEYLKTGSLPEYMLEYYVEMVEEPPA